MALDWRIRATKKGDWPCDQQKRKHHVVTVLRNVSGDANALLTELQESLGAGGCVRGGAATKHVRGAVATRTRSAVATRTRSAIAAATRICSEITSQKIGRLAGVKASASQVRDGAVELQGAHVDRCVAFLTARPAHASGVRKDLLPAADAASSSDEEEPRLRRKPRWSAQRRAVGVHAPPRAEVCVPAGLCPLDFSLRSFRDACDVWYSRRADIPRRRVAAPPRPRRGYSAKTGRGAAAAGTRIFRGDESRC